MQASMRSNLEPREICEGSWEKKDAKASGMGAAMEATACVAIVVETEDDEEFSAEGAAVV
jgi:hypothetical protein